MTPRPIEKVAAPTGPEAATGPVRAERRFDGAGGPPRGLPVPEPVAHHPAPPGIYGQKMEEGSARLCTGA